MIKDDNNKPTQWAIATSKGSKVIGDGKVKSNSSDGVDPKGGRKIAINKFNQLLLIAKFLFDKGLVHGDLHLENLKERDDGSIAAFDFGLVKIGINFTNNPLFDFQYLLKGGNYQRQLTTNLSKFLAPEKAAKHNPLKKILLDGGFPDEVATNVLIECQSQFKELENTYKNFKNDKIAFQKVKVVKVQGNKHSITLPSQGFSDAVHECIEKIMISLHDKNAAIDTI